jgi:hypothetical protein
MASYRPAASITEETKSETARVYVAAARKRSRRR